LKTQYPLPYSWESDQREYKRGAAPLILKFYPSPAGERAGRHPARIYSRWDMGNGIGQGEGESVILSPSSINLLRINSAKNLGPLRKRGIKGDFKP
jgi:hypothetical protein